MIELGVIGTGPITARHLDVASELDGVSIAAICGRRPEPRQALAGKFRIPRQVEDYRDLLRDDRIDAMLVLVAPDAIASVAAAALATGRPTFLEKPPGLCVSAAADLADTASRRKTLNMVGLNRRFYSSIALAHAAIASAGRLRGLRIEAPEDLGRARSAGRSEAVLSRWIYANSLHAIDLLRYLGGPVRSGHVTRRSADTPDSTSIVATLELECGVVAEYVAHWGSPGPWSVTMYGDGVTAVLSPMEEAVTLDRSRTATALPVDDVDRRFKPGFYRQMKAFLDLVRSGGPLPRPGADLDAALVSMKLAAWLTGDTEHLT